MEMAIAIKEPLDSWRQQRRTFNSLSFKVIYFLDHLMLQKKNTVKKAG